MLTGTGAAFAWLKDRLASPAAKRVCDVQTVPSSILQSEATAMYPHLLRSAIEAASGLSVSPR